MTKPPSSVIGWARVIENLSPSTAVFDESASSSVRSTSVPSRSRRRAGAAGVGVGAAVAGAAWAGGEDPGAGWANAGAAKTADATSAAATREVVISAPQDRSPAKVLTDNRLLSTLGVGRLTSLGASP